MIWKNLFRIWKNEFRYPSSSLFPLISGPKQTITLNQGSFTSAQPVDITFVLRADAKSITKCCKKLNPNTGLQELFCTRATATVEWDNTITNPVRFDVGGFPIRAN